MDKGVVVAVSFVLAIILLTVIIAVVSGVSAVTGYDGSKDQDE